MVFSNTTPFIALCSVNQLHLMPAIFGTVNVAPSVLQECAEGGKIFVPDLAALPWIKIQTVTNERQLPALFESDRYLGCFGEGPCARPDSLFFTHGC
jgi:predicted nucleic acid-binding protein